MMGILLALIILSMPYIRYNTLKSYVYDEALFACANEECLHLLNSHFDSCFFEASSFFDNRSRWSFGIHKESLAECLNQRTNRLNFAYDKNQGTIANYNIVKENQEGSRSRR